MKIHSAYAFVILLHGSSILQAAGFEGRVLTISETSFSVRTYVGPVVFKFSDYHIKGGKSPVGPVFDNIYPIRAADLKIGMLVELNCRKAGVEWICEGIRLQNAEIKFLSLEDLKKDFSLKLKLTAEGGHTFEKTYLFKAGTTIKEVQEEILFSFDEKASTEGAWYGTSGDKYGRKNILDMDGFYKDKTFHPIEKVEVSCPDVGPDLQPKVRQMRTGWNDIKSSQDLLKLKEIPLLKK